MEVTAEALLSTALEGLRDRQNLNREMALKEFTRLQDQYSSHLDHSRIEQSLQSLLDSDIWEARLGGLNASKTYVDSGICSSTFCDALTFECIRLLEDVEVRVRLAVGDLLASLARKQGLVVYETCKQKLLTSIYENFERVDDPDKGEECSTSQDGDLISALLQTAYKPVRPGQGDMRHGTEGWKCLETSTRAFQQILEACGDEFKQEVTPELRQLLYRSVHHPNRFVRETSQFTLASMCQLLRGPELAEIAVEVAQQLQDGLSDNWSQVRYAANVATRRFLDSLSGRDDVLAAVYPVVLPALCLNRYYVAEGVRLYAQQTWRQAVGDTGRDKVARYIQEVVDYDIKQSKANNHAVREAACACIAELMSKVDPSAVGPHVPALTCALILCFKDSSWPVRDAACVACGRCVLAYPEQLSAQMEELYALWFAHVWDNIPTVRADTAAALGNTMRAYGAPAIQRVTALISDLLPRVHEQPDESAKYSELENVTQFGVAARRARDQDAELHSGQDMFSCGSLVARFSTARLVKSDGCNDYGFARTKQPWEATDGAVYLLRELAEVSPEAATPFLEPLADVARVVSFQHAFSLHATIWDSLPALLRAVGRGATRSGVSLFMPQLLSDLTCGHQLAEVAAGRCVAALRDLMGPSIFAGRLTPEQRALLDDNPNVPPVGSGASAIASRSSTTSVNKRVG